MLSRSSDSADILTPDALSEILRDLRPLGVSYGHCRLTKPWGVDFPKESSTRLHFVVSGESWLRKADYGSIRLQAGDVALLPKGGVHAMADTPHGRTKPLSSFPREQIGDRIYRLAAGGSGSQTLLACCSVNFEEPALHPLLELMPPILLVCKATLNDSALPALLDLMAEEVMAQRVGGATVLARLADIIIVRLIRTWVESHSGDTTGWLAAVRDPQVGRALAAMHKRPGYPWSVRMLGEAAGISRSLFSERFTVLLGVSPSHYLAKWRMHLASAWLSRDRLSISEVATRLGYQSEPAFSRAFKRLRGVPPSSIRQAVRNGNSPGRRCSRKFRQLGRR
jgi:AraC-like DNA-binding protein